uniref:Pecanex-like protein n=1 Tax=Strongyloides venezuelensis TaxID=75913 RepID=A0A0K0EZQ7_STRVS
MNPMPSTIEDPLSAAVLHSAYIAICYASIHYQVYKYFFTIADTRLLIGSDDVMNRHIGALIRSLMMAHHSTPTSSTRNEVWYLLTSQVHNFNADNGPL